MHRVLFLQRLNTRFSVPVTKRALFEPCQCQCSRPLSSISNSTTNSNPRSYTRKSVTETRRHMTNRQSPPVPTSESLPVLDDKVSSKLFTFCDFVKFETLTDDEKLIHSKHLRALQNQQEMYEDPSTGYSVLTRLAHLKRGQCCGNACRHCPYGQKNVPVEIPKKKYNSAFFV